MAGWDLGPLPQSAWPSVENGDHPRTATPLIGAPRSDHLFSGLGELGKTRQGRAENGSLRYAARRGLLMRALPGSLRVVLNYLSRLNRNRSHRSRNCGRHNGTHQTCGTCGPCLRRSRCGGARTCYGGRLLTNRCSRRSLEPNAVAGFRQESSVGDTVETDDVQVRSPYR